MSFFLLEKFRMRKLIILFVIAISYPFFGNSQLAVLKMISNHANDYKIGFCLFGNYDIPVKDAGNQSVMLELLDFGYFPAKSSSNLHSRGYVSIKIGFRKIFSEEGRTGFFVVPQLGYCRVAEGDDALGY